MNLKHKAAKAITMSIEEKTSHRKANRSTFITQIEENRAHRMERLRRAIADGTYTVSAEDVAEKIINRFMRHS
ncbi:MAG: flagellar biosynthesis anti-sigma factor FlgM [Terriglobia bacterium]|jgi:anti-sigma28 factor (negative regulator of flagellin synthesis)